MSESEQAVPEENKTVAIAELYPSSCAKLFPALRMCLPNKYIPLHRGHGMKTACGKAKPFWPRMNLIL